MTILKLNARISKNYPEEMIEEVKKNGMKVGIAVSPDTSEDMVMKVGDKVDLLLVMSVYPGFGGQAFFPRVLTKVRELRKAFPKINIQIDGGISESNLGECAKTGVNSFVAGTSLFSSPNPKATIAKFREIFDANFVQS